ncbi:hypothetical protein U8C35_07585 [Sinorhizobium medicae]|uniref:hypothetical protein n=1 Tax=Sinorhizobium medicae TaxID=110321 RepID=UPI002AF6BDCB|nr:hypothetical protein [Sinorhizobium medicae]WQO60272.1 hypothetical protein U8C35_07585 [Sinorhizobium medicae]
MTDRPILFSAPMVRALLSDRKTQTRRLLKPQPQGEVINYGWQRDEGAYWTDQSFASHKLPIWAGYRLWVKETWRTESRAYDDLAPSEMGGEETVLYDADADWSANKTTGKTRVSIHMPRWASRTTLIVTDVRVERLQDISEADARAEGCPVTWDGEPYDPPPPEVDSWQGYGRASFFLLWSKINGPGSWDANPWVAAYSFRVIKQNIDQIERVAA